MNKIIDAIKPAPNLNIQEVGDALSENPQTKEEILLTINNTREKLGLKPYKERFLTDFIPHPNMNLSQTLNVLRNLGSTEIAENGCYKKGPGMETVFNKIDKNNG